ncbi:MAG: VOC family protein [Pseudomonadota bacterium]|nr:VOC family protein [Pseudomonadota bacterium]
MIDHMSLNVADFDVMLAFYEKVLAPLGCSVMMRFGKDVTGHAEVAGLGAEKPFFWLAGTERTRPIQHIAFRADTRAEVDAFYEAAMAAGAKDNGPPGIRAMYHPDYYGAFVHDPEGHNIEAVCHRPESGA